MKRIRHYLTAVILILSYCFATSAPATQYALRSLRHFDAPEIGTVKCNDFHLDTNGYLWIASEAGLLKFDGVNFVTYTHDDNNPGSISSNRINKVLSDPHGNIWVATSDGLNRFDPLTETFSLIPLPAVDLNGYIIDMKLTHDGTLAFVTSGVGLFYIEKTATGYDAVRSGIDPVFSEINSFIPTFDGGMIAGTHSGNLARIKANGNVSLHKASNTYFVNMVLERDGNVIAYTTKEVFRVHPPTMEITPIDISDFDGANVNSLSLSDDGKLYIATNGRGIWTLEAGENKPTPISDLFSPLFDADNSKIHSVYISPDGNLWFSNMYGAFMVPRTPVPFTYHPLSPVNQGYEGGITAIATSPQGLWIATEHRGITHMSHSGEIIKRIPLSAGRDIWALYYHKDGNLYAVTGNDALWRIDTASGKATRLLDIDRSSIRYYISGGGRSSSIFLGIRGDGIVRYEPESGESKFMTTQNQGEERLHNNWIASMFTDSRSRLWIGLFSGLACYDIMADSFRIINQAPFMKGSCNAIVEMKDGRLLLGTSHGLHIYNPENDTVEKTFTASDGLTETDILSLQIDNQGIAWAGTMRGLNRVDPSTGAITTFQGGYGLSETSFLNSSFSREPYRMYFSGNLGYTDFDPTTIQPVTFNDPINISGIYLNGHRLTLASMVGGRPVLEADENKKKYEKVNISYDDNNLMIKLSTMDFRDASNVAYEWMLKGIDHSWVTSRPGQSSIVIPKLSPGSHTLLIRASDSGVTSGVTELTIFVTPPWYLSTVAKIIYFLIFMGILALIYMLIKKKNAEDINEAKVKFFMDISHEIRSPVTCIISPLESLLRKDLDSDTKTTLRGMHRNAGRILSLTNQLLEIRKIDKGKKRLKMRPTDLNGFAMELIELFRPMAESKGISISLASVPDDMPLVWIDRTNFDKVLVNLITNAIKFTPQDGDIVIEIGTVTDPALGQCARITVTDNGIGIDPKNINRIFERFYQGQGASSGFGVGLNLSLQLVKLHHGNLTAANRTDGEKGSVFTVLLPLGNEHLSPEEIADDTTEISLISSDTPRIPSGSPVATIRDSDTPVPAPKKRKNTRQILIVDDDTELREYLSNHFSHTDKVLQASDGIEALELVRDNKIDLIISDVVMPRYDGLRLLRALKSNVDTIHIPVILLSSRNDIADRMSGWDHGADGYIGKPFDIAELDAMADNLIDNRLRIRGKFTGAQDTDEKIATPAIKGNDEMLMEKIMKAIDSRIDDPLLNVEELGAEVGISRAHLHRKMKELIGITPADFIRNIRLRRACEMLKKPDVDISQVAVKLGFTSQPHFSSAFKRFTGVSPSEYRLRNMGKPDEASGPEA
ncbi:MAG: helix-turn-helix domain-containing protein [Paenibacillus sp.]|nr:helix-turn-helix domain-containing protein [Paenibacillus sp.]